MTFYEAIVPVCLDLYAKGALELSESSDWGFDYNTGEEYGTSVENHAINFSNDNTSYINWDMFCAEAKKAAAIIKTAPLYEELK